MANAAATNGATAPEAQTAFADVQVIGVAGTPDPGVEPGENEKPAGTGGQDLALSGSASGTAVMLVGVALVLGGLFAVVLRRWPAARE